MTLSGITFAFPYDSLKIFPELPIIIAYDDHHGALRGIVGVPTACRHC